MIALLAGCTGDDHPRPPPTHTAVPFETIGWGPCGAAVNEQLTLFPEDEGDAAGYELDLADVDGDGCDEVAVSADFRWSPVREYVTSRSSLHVLHRPDRSGALVEVASTTWREDSDVPFPEGEVMYDFGATPVLLPGTRQVLAGGRFRSELDPRFVPYDLPVPQPAGVLPPVPWNQALVEEDTDVGRVERSVVRWRASGVAATALNRSDDDRDFAGHVLLYNLPLDRRHHVGEYRT